jgi:drug/metabolite transporter superfamily protein YnfA
MGMANLRITLLPLVLAALLETGGDAFVRLGLRSTATVPRLLLFLAGAMLLFSYGWTVNAPSWDFGRLIGVYIVCFFLVAQVVSWVVFHQKPSHAVLLGGGFIAIGGLIISLAAPN